MLQIKSQGLTLADLRTSPIEQIFALFFKYQTETRDEILHGYGRVLALASDAHAVLEGTDYIYTTRYINRHATFQVYKKSEYDFEAILQKDLSTTHPCEVIRITETEQGV